LQANRGSSGDSFNTAVGYNAGSSINTGLKNTFIGGGSGSTVTSGDANTFLGAYNGNNGGLDIRTASNNIVLSDGDGNALSQINARGLTHNSERTGVARFGSMLNLTMADDASVDLSNSGIAGAYTINVYEQNGGTGGTFFATFRGGTTLIAEGISGDCANADTDGKICVFKASGSHTITLKNRLGLSRVFVVSIFAAQIRT